jgi:hypothetical protein
MEAAAVTGSVVIATVLHDIMYAMADLIALMAGMSSIAVSHVDRYSYTVEP